ncbi:MAG: DUF4282 domain-containing protein [Actinomycetes bacterium]
MSDQPIDPRQGQPPPARPDEPTTPLYGAPSGSTPPPAGGSVPAGGGYVPPAGGYQPAGSGGAAGSQISGVEAKGFFGALFDFSFTSFATAKIVKFVYVLLVVATALVYLGYSAIAFRINAGLGVFVLLIIGPIMVIVILAIWRMTLEFYLGVARMSDDIRTIRSDRGL